MDTSLGPGLETLVLVPHAGPQLIATKVMARPKARLLGHHVTGQQKATTCAKARGPHRAKPHTANSRFTITT